MERLKKIEEITEPDHRSTGFGMIDVSDGISRNMTLGDFYKNAERLRVNEGAPEDVRSYMEAVKTLFVYGWFYYPFFTLSAFMATTAVEMALKRRLQTRPDDPSGLKTLFDKAISQGLLRDESFPSREHVQANRAAIFGENAKSSEGFSVEAGPPYAERVAGFMRHFRNVFAHPSGHWILFPGQALNFLVLAGEVINQLWPSQHEDVKP
jgi:hypothetical protein